MFSLLLQNSSHELLLSQFVRCYSFHSISNSEARSGYLEYAIRSSNLQFEPKAMTMEMVSQLKWIEEGKFLHMTSCGPVRCSWVVCSVVVEVFYILYTVQVMKVEERN